MNLPDGIPPDYFRDAAVQVARQRLTESARIDFENATVVTLAGIIGGLEQVVRDLLTALGEDHTPGDAR